MNRYFLKIDPINECVGGFGQSRMTSRWDGGEIAFESKGPRFAVKESTELAPQIQVGDELWIWTHEKKGGQGLVAQATAANVDLTASMLRITLSDVALVSSPFGFDRFKELPDNGHDTGTRVLDYKSISRGTGVYLIEDDDFEDFVEIVDRFGGGFFSEGAIGIGETNASPTEFSWADEIEKEKEDILSALKNRRLSSQKVRHGQSKFRDDLLDLYGEQCVLTDCAVPEALEAAHVLPHNGDQVRDRPDNGLLLRRDLHTMFDAMLWSIDPKTGKVRLARRLLGTSYDALEGKVINHQVDLDALLFHYTQFQKADKNA